MTRLSSRYALMGAGVVFCLMPAGSAFAQAQSSEQQKCINAIYKAGAKIIGAVGKNFTTCVSDATDASLPGGQTTDDCLAADNGLGIGKAQTGLITASTKSCSAVPTIGPNDAAVAADAFADDPMRAGDLFGLPVDDAIVPSSLDSAGAYCQEGVVASLGKLMKAMTKEFDSCVSSGLRAGTIDSPTDVGACVGVDASGKVLRAVQKTQLNIDKRCPGLMVADYFPGACAAEPLSNLAACSADLLDCGICLTMLAAGGVTADCDALDNGQDDNSCGPDWPATPEEYVAGPTAYISDVQVPTIVNDEPTCCRDFGTISRDFIEDGTDKRDNALARLADSLSGIGFDLEALLNEAIQDGSVSLLLDHPGLDTMSLPEDELALTALTSEWTNGTDYSTASAGTGQFLIERGSFVPGKGEPLSVFYPSMFDEGVDGLQAGPSTLNFPIPFGIVLLDLPIASVNITGDSTVLPAGIQYDNGAVSGYLLVDSFYTALNQLLDSPLCDCLGHTQSLYYQDEEGAWTSQGRCVSMAADKCPEETESICVTLGGDGGLSSPPQVCTLLPVVIEGAADIDLNNNPSYYEGFSAGFNFSAVPATVVGVTP
ncbi:MAG TPA: hypothetical protein VEC57_12005 [Candidatus Limnocylindrales bacterium]|nr:hypothetical protein [Candidatus Limnocylindrales bacterium]